MAVPSVYLGTLPVLSRLETGEAEQKHAVLMELSQKATNIASYARCTHILPPDLPGGFKIKDCLARTRQLLDNFSPIERSQLVHTLDKFLPSRRVHGFEGGKLRFDMLYKDLSVSIQTLYTKYTKRLEVAETQCKIQRVWQRYESHPTYPWTINGKDIALSQDSNDLIYIVKANVGCCSWFVNVFSWFIEANIIKQGLVAKNLNPLDMKLEIARLKEYQVILKENDTPVFARTLKEWSVGNTLTISLLIGRNNLTWRIFDRVRKRIADYSSSTEDNLGLPNIIMLPTQKCSENTCIQIFKLEQLPLAERVEVLDDFTLTGIHSHNLSIIHPISIVLEPKSTRSKIDNRVLLSKFQWAVTVTIFRGQHAQLVIEGIARHDETIDERPIRNKEYFMVMADFDATTAGTSNSLVAASKYLKEKSGIVLPPISSRRCGAGDEKEGRVKVKNFSSNPHDFQYLRRTEIWKIPSERVEKILRIILQESRKEIPVPKLNLLGRHSVLAQLDEDSCFTYSMGKVKAMEPLSFFWDPEKCDSLVTLPFYYTQPKEFYTDHPAKFQDAL